VLGPGAGATAERERERGRVGGRDAPRDKRAMFCIGL
jgi:hypothetical protein